MNKETAFRLYLRKRGHSTSTISTYVARVKRFLKWLAASKTEDINTEYRHLIKYVKSLKEKGYQQGSIQMEMSAISHYFNSLKHQGIVQFNPVANLVIKNTKQQSMYSLLSNEQLDSIYKSYRTERCYTTGVPPQHAAVLARQRNKVIVGLLVFQGLSAADLKEVEIIHVKLQEGMIEIPATRKSASRSLQLQANQIMDIMLYVSDTRQALLKLTGKATQQLFVSTGKGNDINNSIASLTANLKVSHPQLIGLAQIRASVIVAWLQHYNLRKVQYMAGHKHISSTEAYKRYVTDKLADDIGRYHPLE